MNADVEAMFAVSDSIEGLTKALNAVKKAPAETEPIVVDAGLSGIEVAIAELANAVRSYVQNAGSGENRLKIFTGEEGAGNYPVLIALDPCSETTEDLLAVAGRIASAFERIADALSPRSVSPTEPMGEGGVKS